MGNSKDYFHKTIATGLGSGLSPVAPGTAGTVVAVISMLPIYLYSNSVPLTLGVLIVGFYILGTISTSYLEKEWGKDPGRIVIDEIVGYWIALLFVPISWQTVVLAFILFRFFDIIKPLGIKKLESINGAHGVMLDDVLAGIYSNIIIQVLLYLNVDFQDLKSLMFIFF